MEDKGYALPPQPPTQVSGSKIEDKEVNVNRFSPDTNTRQLEIPTFSTTDFGNEYLTVDSSNAYILHFAYNDFVFLDF